MIKRAYTYIPEGHVYYRTAGSGDPLLLLHSTPQSSEQYLNMIPILAKQYRVLAMDTLGYGFSDDPSRMYEIGDFARSVATFLESLQINKVNIVGHGTGAAIAAEVAAAYPTIVDKLILSGYPYWSREKWDEFFNNPKSPGLKTEITEDGLFLIDAWQSSKKSLPNLEPKARLSLLIRTWENDVRPYDAHYAVSRYDFEQRLPLISSPTLLAYGSSSPFIDSQEATRRLIPRCKTHIIENAGSIPGEKPKEFSQEILGFLENPGV